MLKPAPGSRKISIVGFQQLNEVEQMLFVSNQHVFIKFRGGKIVTLLSNGSIIHQDDLIQALLEKSTRFLGESQIFKGKKFLLLEEDYGEDARQEVRYVALQFEPTGKARCVGIYESYE